MQILLSVAALAALSQPVVATSATQVPPPATVQADTDEAREREASVTEVTELRQGNVAARLYGTVGGDPAMNGLYTYLSFYHSPAEGHRVFMIGDFNEYRVHEEAPGRIVLDVEENYMDQASGDIGNRSRRITITWTPGPDDTPPASIRIVHAPIE